MQETQVFAINLVILSQVCSCH